jgi:hypothetical protein
VLNVAVTDRSLVIVCVHVPPSAQAPPQFAKYEPAAALAVRVTLAPV